jgi:hypothetical protein
MAARISRKLPPYWWKAAPLVKAIPVVVKNHYSSTKELIAMLNLPHQQTFLSNFCMPLETPIAYFILRFPF